MKFKWLEKLPVNDKIKKLIQSIYFYLIIVPIGIILNYIFPSDMCNPGLGAIFFIFILPLTVIGLVIWNFILLACGKKENIYSFGFHLSILIIGFVCLKLG